MSGHPICTQCSQSLCRPKFLPCLHVVDCEDRLRRLVARRGVGSGKLPIVPCGQMIRVLRHGGGIDELQTGRGSEPSARAGPETPGRCSTHLQHEAVKTSAHAGPETPGRCSTHLQQETVKTSAHAGPDTPGRCSTHLQQEDVAEVSASTKAKRRRVQRKRANKVTVGLEEKTGPQLAGSDTTREDRADGDGHSSCVNSLPEKMKKKKKKATTVLFRCGSQLEPSRFATMSWDWTRVTNLTGRRGRNRNPVSAKYTRNSRQRQPCLQEPDPPGDLDERRAVSVERPRQRRHREAVAKMVRSRPTGHMPRHKRHKRHRDRRYKFDDFDDLAAERPTAQAQTTDSSGGEVTPRLDLYIVTTRLNCPVLNNFE